MGWSREPWAPAAAFGLLRISGALGGSGLSSWAGLGVTCQVGTLTAQED